MQRRLFMLGLPAVLAVPSKRHEVLLEGYDSDYVNEDICPHCRTPECYKGEIFCDWAWEGSVEVFPTDRLD